MTERIDDLIKGFWREAEAAVRSRQDDGGAGWMSRSGFAVGAHQHLEKALVDELIERGIDPAWIRTGRGAELPGFHAVGRPWDITIVRDDIPLAAIIIKAQSGSGSSKNVTNRIQEFMASAFDVRRGYGSPDLDPYQPFLGLIFILEDSEQTTRPIAGGRRTAPGSRRPSSVKERFEDAFQRFLVDELYDGICYATPNIAGDADQLEPRPQMGMEGLLSALTSHVSQVGELREGSGLTSVRFGELLVQTSDIDALMTGFTSTRKGLVAAEAAVIRRRRELIANLRVLALSEGVNETAMQKALGGNYWLFGGQYVGVAERRDLMPLQQHDIPLISADQSLNIIELKGPEAPLVRRHRKNHAIVTADVHEAVGQCMNYLRTMDELGAALRTIQRSELGIDHDYRRARATVVIGHPDRSGLVSREEVDQTIRTYNAHLSRIQVLTYADLLDSAERALNFEELAGQSE
ncbi:Shedu anti-phage system protein SduA domain-containing protein [Kitasatospora sp. NPDC096147]|uniref:Shedu anti-phage system protein SduA domain-containing protein n=1 Tax=Kitasatospora sp. NPDC096147 TaxID=3364093 RepID=UPI00380B5448